MINGVDLARGVYGTDCPLYVVVHSLVAYNPAVFSVCDAKDISISSVHHCQAVWDVQHPLILYPCNANRKESYNHMHNVSFMITLQVLHIVVSGLYQDEDVHDIHIT